MTFSARGSGSRKRRAALLALACGLAGVLGPTAARAHVGSPDTYAEANAGPYRLLVTVRPPLVIPGVAEIEVRAIGTGPNAPQISNIQIAPIPLTGEASLHPPVADPMKQSAVDKQFFTGALWIMASGSWQVRFTVDGSQGKAVLSIPVPATSSSTRGMQAGLGILLSVLGLLLIAGVVGIVGAAARDAQLPPGATASEAARKRALIAMTLALVLMIAAVWGGKVWWKGDADDYARYVYKPLTMQASVGQATDGQGQVLSLKIKDPGWLRNRKTDDFVLDHDHLMHLYLIRQPGLDVVYHLHPDQIAPREFQLALPSIPAGDYRLYADVVHATGFPETLVARLTLPAIQGRPLAGDDARGLAQPVNSPSSGATCPANPVAGARFVLSDGYTMVWDNAATVAAKAPEVFEFSLLDSKGEPASDTALYMGMLGHAAFVREDGTVFAHVHPSGTVSMTALLMAAAQNQPVGEKTDAMAAMPEMESSDEDVVASDKTSKRAKTGTPAKSATFRNAASKLPNTVGFPYGFPTAGAYRIFVQMKHGATIETAAFDACAGEPSAN